MAKNKKKHKKKQPKQKAAKNHTKSTKPAERAAESVEVSRPKPVVDRPSASVPQAKTPQKETRPMTVYQPPPVDTGFIARLLTTGHTNPDMIWAVWFFNLLAAFAWNAACYPFIDRLMQGQSSPGIKLLDTCIALVGTLLVLRVVTLLSDLRRSPTPNS